MQYDIIINKFHVTVRGKKHKKWHRTKFNVLFPFTFLYQLFQLFYFISTFRFILKFPLFQKLQRKSSIYNS